MSDAWLGDERTITVEPREGAPASWRQLAVLVLDGSLSMKESTAVDGLPATAMPPTKAQAVDNAVRDLLRRLATGRVKRNFAAAFVDFNDTAVVDTQVGPSGVAEPVVDLVSIDIEGRSFDPTRNGTGNGTRLEAGLEAAAQLIRDFHAREIATTELPTSAVVLVMSDGETADPDAAAAAAKLVKSCGNTFVATALFSTLGRPAHGGPLLQAIADDDPSTGRRMYATVYDAEQLREFFHRSVTAAVKSFAVRPPLALGSA